MDYELTSLGRTLLDLIDASRCWARDHLPTVLAARDAYENHATQPNARTNAACVGAPARLSSTAKTTRSKCG